MRGEREAEPLVEALGYTIVEQQATRRWELVVDGAPVEIEVRADLVLKKDGRRFVADVKTGETAPSIGVAATRRQLLEYLHAYGADGVLLVDMHAEEVREIEFPDMRPRPRPSVKALVIAFAVGVVAGVVLMALR